MSASFVLASLRGLQRTYNGTPRGLALAAAVLDGHFEHPAGDFYCCASFANH